MPSSYLGGDRQTIGERQARAHRVLGPLPAVDLGPRWQCFCGGTCYVRYRGRFYCPRCGHRQDHPDELGYHDTSFRQAFEEAAGVPAHAADPSGKPTGGNPLRAPNLAQDRAGLPPIDALDRILAAAGGPTARLHIPAALEHVGQALFLLVNRSIRHDHARPLTRHHWVCIDPLMCEMAEAFVEGLGQPRRSVFWRGSGLAGLRILLGRSLAVVQDDSGFASELCITDPAAALDRAARFLRRRGIRAAQAGIGFDALVATYRQPRLDRPGLASFGQGGEWPADTPRLRARLLALVEGTAGPLPAVPGLRAC